MVCSLKAVTLSSSKSLKYRWFLVDKILWNAFRPVHKRNRTTTVWIPLEVKIISVFEGGGGRKTVQNKLKPSAVMVDGMGQCIRKCGNRFTANNVKKTWPHTYIHTFCQRALSASGVFYFPTDWSQPPQPQREQPSSHRASSWHGSLWDSTTHTHTFIRHAEGVCVHLYATKGALRFTALAPGVVKWVDRCHSPHQLP